MAVEHISQERMELEFSNDADNNVGELKYSDYKDGSSACKIVLNNVFFTHFALLLRGGISHKVPVA